MANKKSIVNTEKIRKNLIHGVPNSAIYDDKIPTNVRLDKTLKERAMADAKKLNTSLSEIINGLLREEYGD